MKLTRKSWLVVLGLLFCSGYVEAATLHAIIVADTLDPEIKAKENRDRIKTMVETISQNTGLELQTHVFDGDTISRLGDGYQQVRTAVKQLQPSSDDVVLFYYDGHGVRDPKKTDWPALALQGIDTPDNGLLRLAKVEEILQEKQPRLLLVLADTCNKFDVFDVTGDRGRVTPLPGTSNAYKVLFLESQGSIIASGAIPGQDSGGDAAGGYFTQAFVESLSKELDPNNTNPRWETVMDNTEKEVKKRTIERQTPQAKVKVTQIANNIHQPTTPSAGNETQESLSITVKKLTVGKFDTDSAQLKPVHQSQLRDWSQDLKGARSIGMPKITVEGHADSKGDELHNLDLSKRRATSVKNYLVENLDADSTHLQVVPQGESQPIADNETESGRAENRRVELIPEALTQTGITEPEKNALSDTGNSASTTISSNHCSETSASSVTPLTLEEASYRGDKKSVFGTCYWGDDSEDDDSKRKWSVFVEEKLWLNTWTGWGKSGGERKGEPPKGITYRAKEGYLISTVSDPELAHILTLGFRYQAFSLGFSMSPKKTYSVPVFFKAPAEWLILQNTTDEQGNPIFNEDGSPKQEYMSTNPPTYSTEDVSASVEREEMDLTVSYALMPQLYVGLGFKKATLDYKYQHYSRNPFDNLDPPSDSWDDSEEYKTYGVSLNVGGQVCLANWLNTNISIFGNLSYGAMKTKWDTGEADPNVYHSTDLGLIFELPIQRLKQFKPEIRLGYRAQTIYTETTIGEKDIDGVDTTINADAVDTTEGFTLGLRVTF